jgi:hypothetical protein
MRRRSLGVPAISAQRTLALSLPPSLVACADEVIQ